MVIPRPFSRTLMSLPFVQDIPWLAPFRFVPRPVQHLAVGRAVNLLLREQLQEGELGFLEGTTLGIAISDLGYLWVLTKRGERLVLCHESRNPDVIIRGESADFLLLASRREDPDTLFFQRRVVVEGDTELGLQVKNLIDSIDTSEFPKILDLTLQFACDIVQEMER
jgi:predicted lipid carrier protein YhbT